MNLDSWFTDTITRAEQASVDVYGDPSFGTQSTFKGRVEHETKLVVDFDGTEILSQHVLATTKPLDQRDRVWFPDDDTTDNNAARRPLSIQHAKNHDGTLTLYEVRFA